MNKLLKRKISFYLFPVLLMSGLFFSCANRGSGPQGGPKDSIPPVLIKSFPLNHQLYFKKNKVELDFNEIVLLEKPHEKIVVSPPQKIPANIKAYGKKVIVQFNDSMAPNTTYTIDFSDAIVDNNEKNPLEDFSMAFSTGPIIDTLMISGFLIDAQTLNPCSGILVGIHQNLEDSAFSTSRLKRVAKTDSKGHFCIRNIEEYGAFRLYALQDMNGNYLFDQPIEKIAFRDTLFRPIVWTEEHIDTFHIELDSIHIDSIVSHRIPVYEPKGVILKLFQEDFFNQYFIKAERREPYKFSLFFNETLDTLPLLRPLNFTLQDNYLIQKNVTMDTLTYWLTDSLSCSVDTLIFELNYPKTDTLGMLQHQIDTLKLPVRREKIQQSQTTPSLRKRKNDQNENVKPKMEFLKIRTNLKSSFDVYLPVQISFTTPIKTVDSDKIHLEIKRDTIWQPIEMKLDRDSIGMNFEFFHHWEPEKSYRLIVDSAAFYDYYGKHSNKMISEFKIRSLEDYASLYIVLKPFTGKEVLQLLNGKEKVIREMKAERETSFEYLEPGEYYLKLYLDENENGKWDPGKYKTKTQPEKVFFFQTKITLRAYWEIEEEWEYTKIHLLHQKPYELYQEKNKKRQ